ncbi:hypothetical protein KG118_10730 [Bacteroides sp. NSJ-90]|mgnify:CR=1 FL=1|uniref:fimbrillin family protein n=1 Tax=Bacteroides propionicigenes TaxID=2834112 RepID=UPI001BCCEF86|nr:fimbrillin family protein [Bacteroides propionicigenes]MBS7574630.1 hypothetical protein [Bacteroides propionicigenes]
MNKKTFLSFICARSARTIALPMIATLAVLSSCGDTDDGNLLPAGQYPLTFTAAIDGAAAAPAGTATRANTVGGVWTAGDAIAVMVADEEGGGDVVKQYTPKPDAPNTLQAAAGVAPFYWQSSTEKKTVSAWHCGDGSTAAGGTHAGSVPTTWSVQTDQNTADGYQRSDFLYAPPKEITFTPASGANNMLAFHHQTAKVVINIKNAEAATDAADLSVTLAAYDASGAPAGNNTDNALVVSCPYTLPESGQNIGAWDVAAAAADVVTGAITPKAITPASGSAYLKTYTALVIPQNVTGKKFIAVTVGGDTYYYIPKQKADGTYPGDLQGGSVHTYDITVKYGSLEVVETAGSGSGTWNSGGQKVPVASNTTFEAATLKPGDYYYSDGSYSDGGLRKRYSDGKVEIDATVKPVLTNPETSKARTVIGIVFCTDENRIGAGEKAKLKDLGVTSPHGLVMALTNAGSGCRWGESGKNENENGQSGKPFVENITTLQKQYNHISGYAETHWIGDKIKGSAESSYTADTYKAFDVALNYGATTETAQYAAPEKTTGWFLPSMGQWWDILENLGGLDLSSYKTSTDSYEYIAGNTALNNLNVYMGKVTGAALFGINTAFWSSSEFSSGHACGVDFSGGSLYLNWYSKDYGFGVRPALAF